MKQYDRYLTADNADVLDATDMTTIPAGQTVEIFIASTQNDTVLLITAPGSEAPITKISPSVRTNGVIAESDDPSYIIEMIEDGHVKIDVDIVTAATVGVRVKSSP